MRSRLKRTLSLVVLSVAVFGCGPTLYAVNASPAAQVIEQAREAGAGEHAPYEYHYAHENLAKAREEAAEANYQDAIRFAELAQEYGNKALDLARRRMREMGR